MPPSDDLKTKHCLNCVARAGLKLILGRIDYLESRLKILNETLGRGVSSPPQWRGRGEPASEREASFVECTCYRDCADDSMSGTWHQHGDDPCPVHPDAPVVS